MQNKQWREEGFGHHCVSVNLSIRVFESHNLLNMVKETLEMTNLAAEYLELEITESILIYDMDDIIKQLKELRELGIKIAMDDFGSGYSSLGSLDQLPIDSLKIDQLFIRELNTVTKKAIIQTIIEMGNRLQLDLIAEGVETEDQIEFLRSSGCHFMQGYYYGKPMDKDEIREWLIGIENSKAM